MIISVQIIVKHDSSLLFVVLNMRCNVYISHNSFKKEISTSGNNNCSGSVLFPSRLLLLIKKGLINHLTSLSF